MIPNYYAALGVAPDAGSAEIKQAYRRLALQHHPDVNAKEQREDTRIKRVNEAYTVLSNPRKRAAYDTLLQQQQEERGRQGGEEAEAEQKLTWSEGLAGFVREFKKEQGQSEPQMSWGEGMSGFVREFKKGMRDD